MCFSLLLYRCYLCKSKSVDAVNEQRLYTSDILVKGEIISEGVLLIDRITCNLIFTAFSLQRFDGVCPLLECSEFFSHQQCYALDVPLQMTAPSIFLHRKLIKERISRASS